MKYGFGRIRVIAPQRLQLSLFGNCIRKDEESQIEWCLPSVWQTAQMDLSLRRYCKGIASVVLFLVCFCFFEVRKMRSVCGAVFADVTTSTARIATSAAQAPRSI